MSAGLRELFRSLPDLFAGHLLLSVGALWLGVLLSVPLGVLATRTPRLRGPLLGLVSLIQTVPSLALLALMVPLLGGRIGFLPAFLALVLYSMLPIVRNTVTGILEVDPAVREAARGLGLTRRQRLFQVELPLAAPVILAGIRTATAWVVGMATLATIVGGACLGQYIFQGLQTRNWEAVLFGCAFVAAMALALDGLIRLLEHAARTRDRRLLAASGLVLLAVTLGGLAPLWPSASVRDVGGATAHGAPDDRAPDVDPDPPLLAGVELTVGAKGFTEQYVLAELVQRELADRGARVELRTNLGSTILFDALREDSLDVCVDYTGTLWATLMKRDDVLGRTELRIELAAWLLREHDVVLLGPLGFENAYALAVAPEFAASHGVRSIGDLAPIAAGAGGLQVGGDPEVFGRPEWLRVRDAYGLGAARTRGMDSSFMYGAVRDGEVDVITAYSTDGRIAAYDLVVLRDPLQAFPPYDAVLLLSPRAARTPGVVEALSPLLHRISAGTMREANRRVDLDGRTPREAAQALRASLAIGN